jgi:tetratricopeptide (TPR) repeat protein
MRSRSDKRASHWKALGLGAAVAAGASLMAARTSSVEAQGGGLPPLFAGIDSVGARPSPQPAEPALYFEAKASWPALGIDEPRTAWEFVQRGMHRQDELEDESGAIEDYRAAEALDSHILLIHARLGSLHLRRGRERLADPAQSASARSDLLEALRRYEEVEHEQPHRAGIAARIGDAHAALFELDGDPEEADKALLAYQHELARSTGHQPSLYAVGMLLRARGLDDEARPWLERYLASTRRHGEPYPWKQLEVERWLAR